MLYSLKADVLPAAFETLISSFIAHKVGIAGDFLSASLSSVLKQHLLSLYDGHQFAAAGTGNQTIITQNKMVRGDLIYWLDRKHNSTCENDFFDLMDSFILYLNSTCYTGITGYEFHFTVYEKDSFYRKHIDQFQNNTSRAFSMIMYLNEDWQGNDGGELCLHHPGYLQIIPPENGTCVFFKSSELAHEVLLTHQPRLSITGWLKTN